MLAENNFGASFLLWVVKPDLDPDRRNRRNRRNFPDRSEVQWRELSGDRDFRFPFFFFRLVHLNKLAPSGTIASATGTHAKNKYTMPSGPRGNWLDPGDRGAAPPPRALAKRHLHRNQSMVAARFGTGRTRESYDLQKPRDQKEIFSSAGQTGQGRARANDSPISPTRLTGSQGFCRYL